MLLHARRFKRIWAGKLASLCLQAKLVWTCFWVLEGLLEPWQYIWWKISLSNMSSLTNPATLLTLSQLQIGLFLLKIFLQPRTMKKSFNPQEPKKLWGCLIHLSIRGCPSKHCWFWRKFFTYCDFPHLEEKNMFTRVFVRAYFIYIFLLHCSHYWKYRCFSVYFFYLPILGAKSRYHH